MHGPFGILKNVLFLGLLYDPSMLVGVIVPLVLWEIIWKGIGLWHAARLGRTGWFVAILPLNSLGILPIIFLLITKKGQNTSNS